MKALCLMGMNLGDPVSMYAAAALQATDLASDFGFDGAALEELFSFSNDHPFHDAREFNLLRNHAARLGDLLCTKEAPRALSLEIHPSFRCNVACAWCIGRPPASSVRQDADAPAEVLRRAIDDAGHVGIEEHVFGGFSGEPLLNPAVPEIIARAAMLDRRTLLVTNGLLLQGMQPEELRRVAQASTVSISLDAGSDTTYEILKGQRNGFSQVMAGLRRLRSFASDRRFELHVGYLLHPANLREIELVARLLRDCDVNLLLFKHSVGPRRPDYDQRQLEDAGQTLDRLRALESPSFRIVVKRDPTKATPRTYSSCWAQYLYPTVDANGDVHPCCYKATPRAPSFGNLQTRSFSEIWADQRHREVAATIDPSRDCPSCPPVYHRLNLLLHFLDRLKNQIGEDNFLAWCHSLSGFYARLHARAADTRAGQNAGTAIEAGAPAGNFVAPACGAKGSKQLGLSCSLARIVPASVLAEVNRTYLEMPKPCTQLEPTHFAFLKAWGHLFGRKYFTEHTISAYSSHCWDRYDQRLQETRYWALRNALGLSSSCRVLDFGCAVGFFLESFLSHGHEAWGMEISEYAVGAMPSRLCSRTLLFDSLSVLERFEDGWFDLVLAKDVLEHIPLPLLEPIWRQLRRMGKRIVVTAPLAAVDGGPYVNAIDELDLTHIIRKDRAWWLDRLGQPVVERPDLGMALKNAASEGTLCAVIGGD